MTKLPDLNSLKVDVGEFVSRQLLRENDLRRRLLKSVDYFAGDLRELETLHSVVAGKLEPVFIEWGWLGINFFDWEAAGALSKLVSLCWSQPTFMRRCLPIIEQAARSGEAPGSSFALHYDTVMSLENKKQVYGAFFDWDADGQLSAAEIIEPQLVDFRRAVFGLESFVKATETARAEARACGLTGPRDLIRFRKTRADWLTQAGWQRR